MVKMALALGTRLLVLGVVALTVGQTEGEILGCSFHRFSSPRPRMALARTALEWPWPLSPQLGSAFFSPPPISPAHKRVI